MGLGSAVVGAGSSEPTVGVNQWPRSQPVLTCSTGPPVDPRVQRSTIRAGARQVGSGQAMTSGMAGSFQDAKRPSCRVASAASLAGALTGGIGRCCLTMAGRPPIYNVGRGNQVRG